MREREDKVCSLQIRDAGRYRVIVFYAYGDMFPRAEHAMRTVLVAQNLEQARDFFPCTCESLDGYVDLEPIRNLVCGRQHTLCLGDASRFHNDLTSQLEARGIFPANISNVSWKWAHELMVPMNEIKLEIYDIGMREGLDATKVLRNYLQSLDQVEISPSITMIKSFKLSLAFIEWALQFDFPDDRISPYCLPPQGCLKRK